MSTFSQWWKATRKTGKPRQFTWVCGTERVLVEEIVMYARTTLEPQPWDYIPLSLEDLTESEVWEELRSVPAGTTPRLVVVRHADQLTDMKRFTETVRQGKKNPQRYIVFVSDDPALPRDGKALQQHMRLGQRGHAVECKPFTQATVTTAVEWVRDKVEMPVGVAGYLLNRADGDLRLARDMCFKLSLYPGSPSMATVTGLMSEYPRLSFESALLARDKRTALMALERLKPDEYSRVVGSLDANLDLVGMVHDMLLSHHTPSQIAAAAGRRGFLVPDIIPVAKHYNLRKRNEIRQTLAYVDKYLYRGEREGVMEGLVALW